MIRHLQKLFALVFFCGFCLGNSHVWAQVQYEPFPATGNLTSMVGWSNNSGTAGQLQVVSGNLTYATLPAPAGNKVAITSSGSEDAKLALTSVITSGSAYASFVIKPESGFLANSTVGSYFFHFIGQPATNPYIARASIRAGSAPNTFNIGVINFSGNANITADAVYGENPTDYPTGSTYLIVIKYDISANVSSIWINPVTGGVETIPAISNSLNNPSASQITAVAIRQSNTSGSGTGNIEIDEIRVGTTWAAVTPSGAPTVAPTITPSTGSINLGDKLLGTEAVATYMLSVANIAAGQNVALTTLAPFTISATENGTFTNTLILTGAELATDKKIYVKAIPTAAGRVTGEIVHTSTGATAVVVGLNVNGSTAYAQDFNVCTDQLPGGWMMHSVLGDQTWACTAFGSSDPTTGILTTAVQMSGFASGNNVNEDWLISPKLDLSSYIIPVLSIAYKTKFIGNDLAIKVSTDYSGSGDPSAATWTNLMTLKADDADAWKNLENLSLGSHKTANTYVAFVYTSTTESAARWILDNFKVENVEKYFAAPNVSFDYGITAPWSPTPASFYTFKAEGFTEDIVISSDHPDFEISKTNTNGSFFQSVTYTVAELAEGKEQELFIRFLPKSEFISFKGVIKATSGSGFEKVLGNLEGSSVLKANTLDVVTWNVEWFGAANNGPSDEDLQYANAKRALQAMNADIIGVQEIVDEAKIQQLAQETGYQYVSETMNLQASNVQKIGFLYKPEVVTVKKEKVLLAKLYQDIKAGTATLANYPNNNSNLFWSNGRLPYMVQFEATIGGKKQTFHVINIHAKANSGEDMEPYNRRKYDVQVLRDSLVAQYANTNLILLGDYNDDVDVSVVGNNPSSYDAFVKDANFVPVTLDLSKTGAFTYESGSFQSFLDHIIISKKLEDEYIENSVKIETTLLGMISNYRATTSDHLPVSARFILSGTAAVSFSVASETKAENAGTFDVTLALSAPTTTEQRITIAPATGGTATAADYTLVGATNGTVVITVPENATSAKFSVSITDDAEVETNEQVVFNIRSVSNDIEIGSGSTYTLTITDNDAPTGIADGTKGQFNVYPNPIDGNTGVRLLLPERIAPQTKVNVSVYGLDGKKAIYLSGTLSEVQYKMNRNSVKLAKGMYTLLVEAGDEYFQTKLIKQ